MDIAQFLADSAQTGGPRTRAHSSSTDQSSRAHSSGSELEEVSRNDGKYCCHTYYPLPELCFSWYVGYCAPNESETSRPISTRFLRMRNQSTRPYSFFYQLRYVEKDMLLGSCHFHSSNDHWYSYLGCCLYLGQTAGQFPGSSTIYRVGRGTALVGYRYRTYSVYSTGTIQKNLPTKETVV